MPFCFLQKSTAIASEQLPRVKLEVLINFEEKIFGGTLKKYQTDEVIAEFVFSKWKCFFLWFFCAFKNYEYRILDRDIHIFSDEKSNRTDDFILEFYNTHLHKYFTNFLKVHKVAIIYTKHAFV